MPLLQRRAIARRASNILPGSGLQFHHDETARQSIYAETGFVLSIIGVFGDRARSGASAMRTASATSQASNAVIV